METVEVYFRGVDEKAVTKILEIQAEPYQGNIKMARVEPSLIGRLKKPKYTKSYTKRPFALGNFYWREVGKGQFIPEINLKHPVKGNIRFTTQTASELLTYGIPTSEQLGQAADTIIIDEENPIGSAFSGYQMRWGSDYPMVVYKKPKTLERERKIKRSQTR